MISVSRPTTAMILVTGALLLFATIAVFFAVLDLSGEVEKNRRMDCVSRVINGFKTPPGCEEYVNGIE